jgi:primosomal protein N''
MELKKVNFEVVKQFEEKIAEFFGSQYAIAVDSCTHGIELSLIYTNAKEINVPKRTYLSVPFLANKLNISVSTLKRLRAGKNIRSKKETTKKLNRIFGQSNRVKKSLSESELNKIQKKEEKIIQREQQKKQEKESDVKQRIAEGRKRITPIELAQKLTGVKDMEKLEQVLVDVNFPYIYEYFFLDPPNTKLGRNTFYTLSENKNIKPESSQSAIRVKYKQVMIYSSGREVYINELIVPYYLISRGVDIKKLSIQKIIKLAVEYVNELLNQESKTKRSKEKKKRGKYKITYDIFGIQLQY